MIAALIPVLGPLLDRVMSKFFPNPADELKRIEIQQAFQLELIRSTADIEKAAAEIIKTEAASSHWLAANWRPLLMVFFACLIGARWFGWSAPGITEIEYLKLWDIIELGLGGYVIGRTAEKIVPAAIKIVKGK
jgi:hypothetical protein